MLVGSVACKFVPHETVFVQVGNFLLVEAYLDTPEMPHLNRYRELYLCLGLANLILV